MSQMKMKVMCEDKQWPLGILRPHIEEHVQMRVDEGWHLRGQVMDVREEGWSDAPERSTTLVARVWFTFVKPAKG